MIWGRPADELERTQTICDPNAIRLTVAAVFLGNG